MSCNPAIGGLAKGHLVKEIDALGGEMGRNIDATGIQFRMLNRSKGPAVRSPRSQADKAAYSLEMKRALEETSNLEIKQATIDSLPVKGTWGQPESDQLGLIKNQLFKGNDTYFIDFSLSIADSYSVYGTAYRQ